MFDRFTDHARKVMSFARQEAERFNHDYIGAEHILLGLVREGSGVAAKVFENLGVSIESARQEVEKLVKPTLGRVAIGQLPFTPRAKKVLELSIEEARTLNHRYVGTEHLLLGLIRENEGIAAQVLISLGLEPDAVRVVVMEFLGTPSATGSDANPPKPESRINKLLEIWRMANAVARTAGAEKLQSEHLLLAVLAYPNCLAAKLLKNHGLDLDTVRAESAKMRGEEPNII